MARPCLTRHAAGIPWAEHPKLFDYVSVGMFAPWKRHERIIDKAGDRLVVGYGWRSEESSSVSTPSPPDCITLSHTLSHTHSVPLAQSLPVSLPLSPSLLACLSRGRDRLADPTHPAFLELPARVVTVLYLCSAQIVSALFTGGVAVWQQVSPATMCTVYR